MLRRADIKDWFDERVWERAPSAGAAAIEGPHIVFTDGSPLSQQIVAELEARRMRCVLVAQGERFACTGEDQYTLNPASGDDFGALIDAVLMTRCRLSLCCICGRVQPRAKRQRRVRRDVQSRQSHASAVEDGVRLLTGKRCRQALPPRNPLR